jgi:toxin ParE1/3/4
MRRIVKRLLAREDLKQIWRYSFNEWGEAQADKYFAEIAAAILKLQAHPYLGRSREDLRAGYYALRVNQHVIYYTLTPGMGRLLRTQGAHFFSVRSERLDRGAGCPNWARPDLWEPRVSNHPRPPGTLGKPQGVLSRMGTNSADRCIRQIGRLPAAGVTNHQA